jgi:hypothetical protein
MQASCGSRGHLILIKMLVLLFVHKILVIAFKSEKILVLATESF